MAMKLKRPKIKSIPYDDFKDNETYEKLVAELNANGANVIVKPLDDLINWGRSNSLWPLTFATSCCGIEFMAVCAARYDIARFGFEVTRNSPRQADVILVSGTITNKMAPVLKRLYDQMADPKYVVAIGGCATTGGPFVKSYHVVKGVDEIIPVNVYVPGCPPRPEAFLYGMMQLQRKVKIEKFFGGANHKQTTEESKRGVSNEELIFEEKLGISTEAIKEKREAAWEEAYKATQKPARPAAKPARPAAKPTDAAAPKKETIVVDKPVTKEDVEKLGKELDKLNEAENKQQPNDNNTAAN